MTPGFRDTAAHGLVPPAPATASALAAAMLAGVLLAGPVAAEPCPDEVEGRLAGQLRGALEADLDWRGDALACQGMSRPDDDDADGATVDGGRLWFRGPLPGDRSLVVVIGIDGLEPGVTGRELETNLTLVVEREGAFFSSRRQASCWADIETNQPLSTGGHAIAGELYCLRGLGEIGAERAVSVPALAFRGWLKPADDAGAATDSAADADTTLGPADLDRDFDRTPLEIVTADGRTLALQVWLAQTPSQRARGLMFVTDLPADRGMLFAFAEGEQPRMWMRNTLIPLDMLFADGDGRIVHVAAETEPESLATIASPEPARFVLELAGGAAAQLGVARGDRLRHPWVSAGVSAGGSAGVSEGAAQQR